MPNAIASIEGVRKDSVNILYKNKHWRLIELLVDSGAVDNVASPHPFPEYRIRQSEGSKKGLHYFAANNGSIPNVGEQHLCFESPEGLSFKVRMQSAEVSRPILSVMKLAEGGNDVLFRQDGGTIRNRTTGKVSELIRKHSVYVSQGMAAHEPEQHE